MLPGWLIAVLVIFGVIGVFIGLIFIIRSINKRKPTKFTVPKIDPDAPFMEPQNDVFSEPDEFENVNFDEPKQEPEVKPKVEPFDPFDFDDDFIDDDERRYREFINGRARGNTRKRPLSPDEEFEKFRREHCYSKFVTDSELARALKDAPKEVRDVILNDLLKSLDLSKYDTKI